MKYFKSCYFEIVGFCNAKCPYCSTGSKNRSKEQNPTSTKSFINPDLFALSLEKLLAAGVIDDATCFQLYNWGEPLLHPELQAITACLCRFNLSYGLSTNASQQITVNQDFIRNLGSVKFSMSGFSQKSYDRIHGFNFAKIKENIENITKNLRNAGYQNEICIDYHIYQFNVQEINECAHFAEKLCISFIPYFAFFNDWWQMQGWLNNTLSAEKWKAVSEDLFCFYIKGNMQNAPTNYRCPQFDTLVIDENANILTCCCLPKDHVNYTLGNIFDDNIDTVLAKKETQAVCMQCLNTGLTHHFHHPILTNCLITTS
jgi:MoaA/NifB/PqqE/SkfB family radical SAM enzyme